MHNIYYYTLVYAYNSSYSCSKLPSTQFLWILCHEAASEEAEKADAAAAIDAGAASDGTVVYYE